MPRASTTSSRYKLATRIWEPILERLNQRLDAACLRRDAWLTKVIEHELPFLEHGGGPNSQAAHDFIAAHLDLLPRKLVTLTLPEPLVRRLDEICESRCIVRDAFLNRLLFLLLGKHALHARLFFDHPDWLQRLLQHTDFSSDAVGEWLSAIPDFRDPFIAVREGQYVWRQRLIEELGSVALADAHLREYGIYTAQLTDHSLGTTDLYGLNVYLPDIAIPGTVDNAESAALLDEFLAMPSAAQP